MEVLEENNKYDTLVLSGGSIKGITILGAIQSAIDKNLLSDVVNYIGTSVGSIISYLLAIGYTPIEIIVYICTHRVMEKLISLDLTGMISGNGAISYQYIQEILEKMTLDKIGYYPTLKELKENHGKTLVCCTYNKTRSVLEYISPNNYPNLPCLIAVRMSSNLPMLFEKFKYMDHEYVDGGIGDNFPIMEGERIGNKVLGIVLICNYSVDEELGFLQDMLKLLYVPISQSVMYRISLSTEKSTILQLQSDSKNYFNFCLNSTQKLDLFSDGYGQFKNFIEKENGGGPLIENKNNENNI